MNIFFGKISQKFDPVQLKEGYYSAPKNSSWFGELQIDDYVYMIGGDKIQFWQAKKWGTKNDRESLIFEVLNPDLRISVSQLIALKFLQITKSLAVLTSRSARNKAFFKLEMRKDIPISDLSNPQYYENLELYRTIKIGKREHILENSEHIQLIFANGKLQLVDNDFIEDSIKGEFVDNLNKKGKGAKMKDTTLEFFSKALNHLPVTIPYTQIGFRRFYDSFFCEYKDNEKYYIVGAFWKGNAPEDLTGTFLKESIWQNGFEDELIDEVNSVPVGSNIAIKASYVRERKKSVMMIKARGIVKKNLQDGHILEVEWEEDLVPFEVPIGSYIKDTIKEVTKREHIQAIWNDRQGITQETSNKLSTKMNHPLNQILYGPPGTGKTYTTKKLAVKILGSALVDESLPEKEKRKIITDEFDRLENNDQIIFTTFHQSMSYEDFVEGIKPVLEDDNNESVQYRIEPGIFKIACANAAYQCYQKMKKDTGMNTSYTFDDLHEAFINHIQDLMEKGDPPIYETLTGKEVTVIKINKNNSIKARAKNSIATRNPAPLTKENIQKLYDKFKSVDEITNLTQVEETVQVTPRTTEFYAVFKGLKEFENREFKAKFEAESENIGETPDLEDKIKKFDAGVYTQAIQKYGEEAHPVVLIIDEINRGNISQIFGELITLIESDKRTGKKEGLKVKLPYSKKEFSVPPNLYLIGTMNTADRSVEALDTALRRRFSFVEMMPEYIELYNIQFGDFNLGEVLETINNRIEALLDRDHTIGHSYFININSGDFDTLKDVFKNCIIPLLQEYFYGDYEKIVLILGSGFVKNEKDREVVFAGNTTNNTKRNKHRFTPIPNIDIVSAIKTLLNKEANNAKPE